MLSISPSAIEGPLASSSGDGLTDWLMLSGNVYLDGNDDGVRGDTEQGLPGWIVYLDDNGNGHRDENEFWRVTDSEGKYDFVVTSYLFPDWPALSTVNVALESQPGLDTPAVQQVPAYPFSPIAGVDFGLQHQTTISPAAPLGGDFRVNDTYGAAPAVASNESGDSVVVWQLVPGGATRGIYAQRFDGTGEAIGDLLQANTFFGGSQQEPSVAMDAESNFVIAWVSIGQEGASSSDIYARQFSSTGTPLGPEFRVNTEYTGGSTTPTVAMNAAGDFVVTWVRSQTDGRGLYAQKYSAEGLPQGSAVLVSEPGSIPIDPALSMDSAGNFVVVWLDGFGQWKLFAQKYDSTVSPIGARVQVDSLEYATALRTPEVAMNASGDFVVAWGHYEGDYEEIRAQRFNAEGVPSGGPIGTSSVRPSHAWFPKVAIDAEGHFILTWLHMEAHDNSDEVLTGIFAQRFDATGVPEGREFRVNTISSIDFVLEDMRSLAPAISMNSTGNVFIAWAGKAGHSLISRSIYAQRYGLIESVSRIEGRVWDDMNSNGLLDSEEVGSQDIIVSVHNEQGAMISRTTTDAGGRYRFDDLPAGQELFVEFVAPMRWLFVKPNQGAGDDIDSDVNPDTGRSNLFSLLPGDGESGPNAGLVRAATISGRVYHDEDGDGNLGPEEIGIAGWVVYLDENENGQWDPDEHQTMTNANGLYTLNNLYAGNYLMRVVEQPYWLPTTANTASLSVGERLTGVTIAIRTEALSLPIEPVGPLFRVNTHTPNQQQNASVAVQSDGQFVVVWESFQQVGSRWAIVARRYDGSGVPLGDEFIVSQETQFNQRLPEVAISATGEFVVAWRSDTQNSQSYDVRARRFDWNGDPIGDEFLINEGSEHEPGGWLSVAMDTEGNLVVAWSGRDLSTGRREMYARRYDGTDTPLGSQFSVIAHPRTFWDTNAVTGRAAGLPTGGFVITWQQSNETLSGVPTGGRGIYARFFDSAGLPITGDILVSANDATDNSAPAVSVDAAGNVSIVWLRRRSANLGDIWMQRLDQHGTPFGGNQLVYENPATSGLPGPAVVVDSDGNTTVMWSLLGQTHAQRYNAAGLPIGESFQVEGIQYPPSIGTDASGNLVVVGHSGPGSNYDVYAQRYAIIGPPIIAVDDVQIVEGTGGSTEVSVTIRLSRASDEPIVLSYSTAADTARASDDYLPFELTSLTFEPGEIVKTIVVLIVADSVDEPDEQFYFDLANPVGAIVGKGRGVVTILDDDHTLTATGGEIVQPVAGTATASFLVTLPYASGLPIQVNYTTADGTAIAGEHYLATSGSLLFEPGQTQKTVDVDVLPGLVDPAGRTILLRLSEPTYAVIGVEEAAISLHGRPDLVVSSISAPVGAVSGEAILYSWTVTNVGNAPTTGPWADRVYLSPDDQIGGDIAIETFGFSGTLGIGESIVRQHSYKFSDTLHGSRWLVVTTDFNNQVSEQPIDLPNTRIADQPVVVQLRPFPDLTVDSISTEALFYAGEQLTVDWIVKNIGNGATNAAFWYDGVWLSTEQTRNSQSIFLGEVPNASYLTPSDGHSPAYSSSLTWNISAELQGTYYVIVETDWRKQVLEPEGAEANSANFGPITIRLPDPADLRIAPLNVQPQVAFSGNFVDVSWTVQNFGADTRAESWIDEIHLVTDTGSQRLAQVARSGDLSNDAFYSVTHQVRIPHEVAGTVTILVRTDATNRVLEQAFEGNNEASVVLDVIRAPQADLEVAIISVNEFNRAGESIPVTYGTWNAGAVATRVGSWTDAFYLSTADEFDRESALLLGRRTFTAPGGTLSANDLPIPVERTVALPLPEGLTGSFYLYVVADEDDRVLEENELNIARSDNQIVVFTWPADLTVSATAPEAAVAGTAILVDWTVSNVGNGNTIKSNWTDRVYLSPTEVFNSSTARLLGTFPHTYLANGQPGPLSSEQNSSTTRLVTIPFDVVGDHFLFVHTNAGNEIYELANHVSNFSSAVPLSVTRATPDLQVTHVTVDEQAESAGPLTVTWTVHNDISGGATNANVWVDEAYLSVDKIIDASDRFLGRVTHSGALQPGASYTALRTFTLPVDFTGTYYVLVRTDVHNVVLEDASEDNNDGASDQRVTISLNAVPNLKIAEVDAPLTTVSGQQFEVTWTVRNDGAATGGSSWDDYVYLSLDQVFDPATDRYLGFVRHTQGLGEEQSYTKTRSFTVPLGLSGPFYVFVRTDGGNEIYERDGEGAGNIVHDPVPMQVNLLPPANLVVGTIVIPADAQPGQLVTVEYTVTNLGPGTAEGNWLDSVYISSDNQWDIGDALLGRFRQSAAAAGLGVDEAYSGLIQAALPGVLPGTYHVIVRSDIRNAIPESNEDDNLLASLDHFEISIPELLPGAPLTGHIGYGQQLYYRINVPVEMAGEALVIYFQTNNASASNEIYARFGSIASSTAYDFRFSAPFSNAQRIVIPAAKAGTYYILAVGDPMQATLGATDLLGEFHIEAEYVQFTVFNESFGQGGTAGNRTIEIDGVKFDRTVTARLVNGTGFELPATQYYRTSETKLYATFDLTQAEPGTYDVVFEKPTTGESVSVSQALDIVVSVPAHLVTSISAPEALARPQHDPPQPYQFAIHWGVAGLNDLPAPLLLIDSNGYFADSTTMLAAELSKHQNPQVASTLQGSAQLRFGARTTPGPQGILMPGESFTSIFFALNDTSSEPISITLEVLSSQDVALDGWRDLLRMRNPSWNDFDQVFDALLEQVNSSPTGLFAMVARNAALSMSHTHHVTHLLELFQMELEVIRSSMTPSLKGILVSSSFAHEVGGRNLTLRSTSFDTVLITTTRQDGSFYFSGLAPDDYVLYCDDEFLEMTAFTISDQIDTEVTAIMLLPLAELTLSLTAPSGIDVSHASATIKTSGRTFTAPLQELVEGILIPAGNTALVTIAAPGAATATYEVSISEASYRLEVVIELEAHVTGTIHIEGLSTDDQILEVILIAPDTDRLLIDVQSIRNGDAFSFTSLQEGVYAIHVSTGVGYSLLSDSITVTRGESVSFGTISGSATSTQDGMMQSRAMPASLASTDGSLVSRVLDLIVELFGSQRDDSRIRTEDVPTVPPYLVAASDVTNAERQLHALIQKEENLWDNLVNVNQQYLGTLGEFQIRIVKLVADTLNDTLGIFTGVQALREVVLNVPIVHFNTAGMALWQRVTVASNSALSAGTAISDIPPPEDEGRAQAMLTAGANFGRAMLQFAESFAQAVVELERYVSDLALSPENELLVAAIRQDLRALGGIVGIVKGLTGIVIGFSAKLKAIIDLADTLESVESQWDKDTSAYGHTVAQGKLDLILYKLLLEQRQRPVAVDDNINTLEDEDLEVNAGVGVLRNDRFDTKENIRMPFGFATAMLVSPPLHAEAFHFYRDGSFYYRPQKDFEGTDGFRYRSLNAFGESIPVALVTLTVSGVDDPPIANPDAYKVAPGEALHISADVGVLANDYDPDQHRNLVVTGYPSIDPRQGVLTINSDGSLDYTPPSDTFFSGTIVAAYVMRDVGDTEPYSEVSTVTIFVGYGNTPPIAVDDVFRVKRGDPLIGNALENDINLDKDTGDQLRVVGSSGDLAINSDGGLTWNTDRVVGIYYFTYTISDDQGGDSTGSIAIEVYGTRKPNGPNGPNGPDGPDGPDGEGNGSTSTIPKVGTFDPNDIVGPAGVGEERFVSNEGPLNYTIRFENDAELANAPVQRLEITQTLDTDLDHRTFRLGSFGFGSFVIDAAAGLPSYQGRLDYREQFGVFIDVLAGVRTFSGGQAEAFWYLTAIDPATGELPVNPLVGFLPPNVDGFEGQGFVTYVIRPKSTTATGAVIDAEARIVFDINPPIDTPPIFNTIDAGRPSSRVQALEEVNGGARFKVSWSGEDDPQGSGLASYDIYVSENDGLFLKWLGESTLTEAVFEGTPGNTYRFYSVARDNVGSTEFVPVMADATTRIAGGESWQILAIHGAPPAWTNSTLVAIDVEFSKPIDGSSFDASDVVLLRNGQLVSTAGIEVEAISDHVYRVTGLASLTAVEGDYLLSIDASGIRDLANLPGTTGESIGWQLDTTRPMSTVQSLPRRQTALSFEVSATGNDLLGSAGAAAAGIVAFDVYVSTDGSPFAFWQSLPADVPTATFTAESNRTYAFQSIARDAAGNVEQQTVAIEASTYVPDLTPPETNVTSVEISGKTLLINWTGVDSGGSLLRYVDLFVAVDGGAPIHFARVTANNPEGGGVFSGQVVYQAIADGLEHQYRFYSIGVDRLGNLEDAPSNPEHDVSLTATFAAPSTLAIANFKVQEGAVQRSYVSRIDVDFNQTAGIQDILSSVADADPGNDRIRLTKFAWDGSDTGAPVPLTDLVRADGQAIVFDFGSSGLGGNRNTNAGDGLYRLEFDLDGDGNFDTMHSFFRLLGDVNGDGAISTLDTQAITAALGQAGVGLNQDVNGDGVVNALDRTLAARAVGRSLHPDLLAEAMTALSPSAPVAATAPSALPGAQSMALDDSIADDLAVFAAIAKPASLHFANAVDLLLGDQFAGQEDELVSQASTVSTPVAGEASKTSPSVTPKATAIPTVEIVRLAHSTALTSLVHQRAYQEMTDGDLGEDDIGGRFKLPNSKMSSVFKSLAAFGRRTSERYR